MDVEEGDNDHMHEASAAAAAVPAFSDAAPALPDWETTSSGSKGATTSASWSSFGGDDSSFTFVPATRRRNPFGWFYLCAVYTCVHDPLVAITTARVTNR